MQLENFMECVAPFKKGTFHTLIYKSCETRKRLADMYSIKKYSIHYGVDYEDKAAVKEYRAVTGAVPNNPATKNEVATDIWGVYLNPKTNKIKFRVSLNGIKSIGEPQYFIGDKQVTKEVYYATMVERGCSIPKYYPPASNQGFRSFTIDNILSFR